MYLNETNVYSVNKFNGLFESGTYWILNYRTWDMKNKPLKSFIWSFALYGSETETVGENEERIINAFET